MWQNPQSAPCTQPCGFQKNAQGRHSLTSWSAEPTDSSGSRPSCAATSTTGSRRHSGAAEGRGRAGGASGAAGASFAASSRPSKALMVANAALAACALAAALVGITSPTKTSPANTVACGNVRPARKPPSNSSSSYTVSVARSFRPKRRVKAARNSTAAEASSLSGLGTAPLQTLNRFPGSVASTLRFRGASPSSASAASAAAHSACRRSPRGSPL
mmetsp:Transcript_11238/g.30844  ORF Transcript_11238/g.30844 Transcript_11238/m.30844 type:complete len:216 (+) Transcript_11238:135-782(+)